MDRGIVALWVCGAYLLVTLFAGLWPAFRLSKSVQGFVAADRSMNTFVLYFVLGASVFSSFAFLGGPGWAYSRGMAALYIVAYGTVGMVPLYFLGPRARRLGEQHGFVTQAEILAFRFDSRLLSVLMAALSLAAFLPYLVIQMKGAGLIVSTLTQGRVPFAWGAAIPYAVVVIYVWTSGALGVGWTNVLQGIFMMAIAWFLGLYLPFHMYGGIRPMFEAIAAARPELLAAPGLGADGRSWPWAAFASSVVVSGCGLAMWPHLFMKSFAAKSDRAVRLTVVLYPTFQIFLVPILLVGFCGVMAYPGVQPADSILPFLLKELTLPTVLVGLVCAGTLAASMSTGDSILHAAAAIGVRDGLQPLLARRISDRSERRIMRGLVVALSLVAFYFAVVSQASLVALLLASYGGIAQILPLMVAAFYCPWVTRGGAIAGLVGGLATNVFFLLHPELSPVAGMHEGVWGLAMNLMLMAGFSAVNRASWATSVSTSPTPRASSGPPLRQKIG